MRDWDLRACARHGHETYAPDETALRERLHVPTPSGESWRCLRCGLFVIGEPRRRGPADEAPILLRGGALRDAFILRLLAVERGVRGVAVLAAAFAVFWFRSSEAELSRYFEDHLPRWQDAAHAFNYDLNDSGLVSTIRHYLTLDSATLTWIGVGLIGYGVVELAEAIGLWLLRRWAEYLAVVATSAGLPLEIYEMAKGVTATKFVVFLVNVGFVLYILLSKRLFGVRGGRVAYDSERASESLLEVEKSAALLPASATRPIPAPAEPPDELPAGMLSP
ncbi:MAG: hypothetical protein QOE76_3885 [Frankiales bacterium]|nr:hypothetical protein [Frankiales bacterium]MDX6246162.1 hypothetical protein [Frankiales bacterium]